MKIHVVQEGETIQSIAALYGVSVDLIILVNGTVATGNLVPGQAIVITFPEKTYIVQNGDTLLDIADSNGVTVLELLRNNPFLADRQYIYPGETLIISYGKKIRNVTTNGYASAYINRDTLRKTLPYLTYLSVLGYNVTGNGEVTDVDDTDILQLTKAYDVTPLLIINTLSTLGQTNVENAFKILNNEANMDRLIDNMVAILKKKGYFGINITYELLSNLTLSAYENFNTKAYSRFKKEGLYYLVTISPNIIFTATEITFEKINYANIASQSDGLVVLNYLWGSFLGPPAPVVSITKINEFLDYLSTMVLPGRLALGLPLIGYDWELPYTVGLSKTSSLSLDSAITLAKQYNVNIQYDIMSQTPFYIYNTQSNEIPVEHIVWFVDARSMDESMKIVTERGLSGSGLWNIMQFVPQLWTVINTQYEIEHIPIS
ncbi:spore germination protein [Anaerotaenia torta]|uniref:LysM peptidoglycan-binding domain-containing protein n=1 Tax=Anaerotaenia torta TaxID=433293 RepID=UPI003D1DF847